VIWMLTDLYDAMEGWTYAHPPCDISPHPTFLRNWDPPQSASGLSYLAKFGGEIIV
jgi:hypothetical protein